MHRSAIYHSSSDDEINLPTYDPKASPVKKNRVLAAMIKNDCLSATKRLDEMIQILEAYHWLTEKFGEGEYADIPGLCKVATLEEIEAKGYSLTPGAYVGVAPAEDDGVDFHQRMTAIHQELRSLQEESNCLMETISKNWEEMGL